MCGITGFNWPNQRLIKRMTNSIKHRGPDQEGHFTGNSISLGHKRLAIIDTSLKGRQPMKFKHLTIVYNGEIYNFKELKKKLKKMRHKFITGTDTEVLLHAYCQWGESCIKMLNGMWAFCIYDQKKKTFFLSRDRFGIKPLYYYFNGEKFIFSSELKAIKNHAIKLKINKKALNYYFNQKYIGGQLTIFENCFKLRPSENLVFYLKDKKIKKKKYYNLKKEINKCKKINIQKRIKNIEQLIEDSVEKRLISDVPVGSFLSGGIDSSLISAIIAKRQKNFKTFSIGFKDKSYNELEYSKIVSSHIKTKHHYNFFKMDEKLLRHILNNLDEPFGDPSIIPTFLLSKNTRKKVTVSLSGDAGDEVFGGYDAYLGYKVAKFIPKTFIKIFKYLVDFLPPTDKKLSLGFKLKKFVSNYDENIVKRHLNWMATFNEDKRHELLGNNFIKSGVFMNYNSKGDLLSLQLNDIHNYLAEDILKKVDAASMLNSLEVRIPYLDYRIVPLTLSLPESCKIKNFTTKHLLKNICSKYLPKEIVNRKKRGFTVPISQWIKKSGLIKEYLFKKDKYNFLNKKYIKLLFNQHIKNKKNNSRELWLIFVFKYWASKNG